MLVPAVTARSALANATAIVVYERQIGETECEHEGQGNGDDGTQWDQNRLERGTHDEEHERACDAHHQRETIKHGVDDVNGVLWSRA